MKIAKSKRIKKEKTFKLVDKILNPRVPIDVKSSVKVEEFHKFVHYYEHDNFEHVLEVVIKDECIKSKLAFFQKEKNKILNATLFDVKKLKIEKILTILRVVFELGSDEILEFSKQNEDIEYLFTIGDIEEVLARLDYLDDKYRVTLWSINLRMICLSLNGCDPDDLYDLCKEYSQCNDSELLADSLACFAGRNISSDVISHIKTNEHSKVKELNEGNAKAFASFFSLISGVGSIDHEVALSYAIPLFTLLPLYDAYRLTIKAISHDITHEYNNISNESLELISKFVNSYKCNGNLKDFNNIKEIINGGEDVSLKEQILDEDYLNYCKGDFRKVIDNFEKNHQSDKYLISKVNLIAKSYVKESSVPGSSVPSLLSEIVTNLIRIYKLNNSNQCILNILSLAYRFNQLEISYHLIISIVKSAPYYFGEDDFISICKSVNLSTIPVTNVTLNMLDKSVVQEKIESSNKSSYLKVKESIWHLLRQDNSDCKEIEALIESFRQKTPIVKDHLEIEFEYYFNRGMYKKAIDLAAYHLTKNRESVFCIPMYKLSGLIESGDYVGIESIIVAHFYESEHRMQSDDLLKDSFEEYIIAHDERTPSFILSEMESVSEIEVFFFLNVCTPKLISHQGIYGNPSDLNMERLKILNLMEEKKVGNSEQISELIRDCMDEIIIAEGLTRISNARISVNIPELTKAILPQVESLIASYNELEDEVEENTLVLLKKSDEHLFTKGERNKIIKKIINAIRLEFLDNPDYGLDKILSSRIRHSFFSDEISRKSLEKKLIVEYDKNGNFEPRDYWLGKYHFVNEHILKDINKILDLFNSQFYALIEKAEGWMKISKNAGDLDDSEFDFSFSVSVENFHEIERMLNEHYEANSISDYIFDFYEELLTNKLYSMRLKLMETFSNEIDSVFSELCSDIESVRRGVAFSELFEAIDYVKNGTREDIKTSSDWFSIDLNKYEDRSIEISKLIRISELFLERSYGSKRCLRTEINYDYLIPSTHTSLVNLSIINLLSNAFKYAIKGSCVEIIVEPYNMSGFKMKISNSLTQEDLISLKSGKLKEIQEMIASKTSVELLKTEGGTGIFKSLYELKLASDKYTLSINIENDYFNVEVVYVA
ncbi:hypothetical protein VCHA38O210_30291 [Vibrio chagasii]|nr:hypothetical protein VCHA43P282_40293 [Vibrio chagasii]CAH7437897.1 hypothetical protein VCHA38O210_30291 [Vibrio chagasii]